MPVRTTSTDNKLKLALAHVSRCKAIIESAYTGETYESIAKGHNISRQRVERIIKNHYLGGLEVYGQSSLST